VQGFPVEINAASSCAVEWSSAEEQTEPRSSEDAHGLAMLWREVSVLVCALLTQATALQPTSEVARVSGSSLMNSGQDEEQRQLR
jgi:hypothetical protein